MKRIAGFLLCVLAAGCGYSATSMLPAGYRTVYVEPFKNEIPITEEVSERTGLQTSLPNLEEDVTRGVIDRFLFDGNLRVTTDVNKADLVLQGALTDFYRQAVRRDDSQNTEEYRLNLVATLKLRDRNGKPLWGPITLVGDSTYFLTGSSAVSESTAVRGLITDFSRRVVEKVIENW